jgi:membrane-associated phospholipid phosphatase
VALILAWVGRPRQVNSRVALTAALVAVVGFSVVLLSYHYLSDAIGGVVLGVLIATLPLSWLAPDTRDQTDCGSREAAP